MTGSQDKENLGNEIVALLASAPGGLSAPQILAGLENRISQPTLSRRLTDLRAQGRVTVVGEARATRYFYTGSRFEQGRG